MIKIIQPILLGKVCKLGGKKRSFLKGTDLTTSNQQMNLNMRQTLDEAVSNDYKLIFGVGFALRDAVESGFDNEETNLLSLTTVLKVK